MLYAGNQDNGQKDILPGAIQLQRAAGGVHDELRDGIVNRTRQQAIVMHGSLRLLRAANCHARRLHVNRPAIFGPTPKRTCPHCPSAFTSTWSPGAASPSSRPEKPEAFSSGFLLCSHYREDFSKGG